jgi:hypothetical protein
MRTEGNPLKENPHLGGYKLHRVIMPVYIPNQEGYYSDAYRIFKISLNSLIATTDRSRVNITVIDNASIPEVESFVRERIAQGEVDQYIHNYVNRGKADAIVGAAKASYEPLVTFTDADVLFYDGWLQRIEAIYKEFPHAGAVSPFPAPNLKFTFTISVWLENLFSIKKGKVVADADLESFAESIGIPDFFKTTDKQAQYYLSRNGAIALVGAGHFVCTYNQRIFKSFDYEPTKMGLKGGLKKIDQNVDEMGLYRLALPEPRVYHMGNVFLDWYEQKMPDSGLAHSNPILKKQNSFLPYLLRKKLFLVVLLLCKLRLR